jgi:hypothetical protein
VDGRLVGTYNADVEIGSDFTALSCAAERGHTDIVNILAGTYNANADVLDEIDNVSDMIEVGLDVQAVLRRYLEEMSAWLDADTDTDTDGLADMATATWELWDAHDRAADEP